MHAVTRISGVNKIPRG